MKKYMLLHYGFIPPTEEIMNKWNQWFSSLGDSMVDMGGMAQGKEISPEGVKDLPWDESSITGYNIIQAENMEKAEEITRGNPFISSIRLYELREG